MEAKVKRTTDNVENLIKELEKQYVDNKPDKKEIKPSKYDEGTGTFYVDEELAKTKMEKKKIPETVKKEEKDLSIDDMLKPVSYTHLHSIFDWLIYKKRRNKWIINKIYNILIKNLTNNFKFNILLLIKERGTKKW